MSCKVTWLGHSALSIESEGYKILVDPFLTDNPSASVSPEKLEAVMKRIIHLLKN